MHAPEGAPGARLRRCVAIERPPARVRARSRRLTPVTSLRVAHDLQLVELGWIQRDHSRSFPPDQTNAEAVTVSGAGAGCELVLVFLLPPSFPPRPSGFRPGDHDLERVLQFVFPFFLFSRPHEWRWQHALTRRGCSSRWWRAPGLGVRASQMPEVSLGWRSRRFRRFCRPPSLWASSCLCSRCWNSRRTPRRAARLPRASKSPRTRGGAGAQGCACARITAASRWPRLGTRRAAGQWFAAPTGRQPTGACAAGLHVCTPRAASRRAPLAFGPDGLCTVRSTRAPRTCRCLSAGERASSAGAPSSPPSAAQSTAAFASVENTKERETWTYVCGAADIRRAASRPPPLPPPPPKSQPRVRRTGCPTVCESTVIFWLLRRYTHKHRYIHTNIHT